jgi:endoglucanase
MNNFSTIRVSLIVAAAFQFGCGGSNSTDKSSNTLGGNSNAGGATADIGGSGAQGGATNRSTAALAGSTSSPGGATSVTDWLHTEGNKILHEDGTRFHGRGANIFDTRQCGSCAWQTPHVDEVIRRVDELVDKWHANFMRFDLTSYASANYNGMTLAQWGDVTQDASYLADLQKIMAHIGTKPGVYVIITVFSHPSMNSNELPTSATLPVYKKLSDTFKDSPHVLYGVTNEPHDTTDAAVLTAMNTAVDAIRSMEPSGGPHHIISVQGTQNYSRDLGYYVTHPITAGGGVNIVYETHAYAATSDWQALFITPAKTIPAIIGEFGPDGTYMTLTTAKQLMVQAEQIEVPYIGWSFSPECSPAMLQAVDNVTDCGTGMPLTPSDWGTAIINQLANPW